MTKLREEIEHDLKVFFEQTASMSHSDKTKTLRLLLEKYSHISTTGHLLDFHDLHSIVSGAKTLFSNKSFPVFLGDKKRQVPQTQLNALCIVETTIGHLNKLDCLKKLPKFDYREDKF